MDNTLQNYKNDNPVTSIQFKTEFDHLLDQSAAWLNAENINTSIVLSSRIRLARNFAQFPFPNCAAKDERERIIHLIHTKLTNMRLMRDLYFFENSALTELDKLFLMERHLVSPDWTKTKSPAAVALTKDESFAIMINEEDHLRIQVLQPGFQINQSWQIARRLDDELGAQIDFAFSEQFGYLTACPTNTGTGMRISIAINLVGLTLKNEIDAIVKSKLFEDLAIRGFYGEGTKELGNFFQVSNQITLGRTEKGILDRFIRAARELINYEQAARDFLMQHNLVLLEDKIYRAKALLTHSRIMNAVECLNLISYLRLGVELGMLSNLSRSELNQLMVLVQPGHLQKYQNKVLQSPARDIIRTELVRKKINL